ncbi:DNA repair protein RecO [Candidatus Sumerlaeota bacterium]|nr:DNA repair protein RecO [Candidatus Sumerlaeota bacterium]
MSPSSHTAVRALVLRGTDIGETSRLVSLFTAEHGRITVRARGVRRRGSRDAAVLEPFNRIEARLLWREGGEVHLYTEGAVTEANDAIRSDVGRAAAAALWVEMLDRIDCMPDDASVVFAWAEEGLSALAQCARPCDLGLLMAWKLLGPLGHQPVLDRCVDTGERPKPPLKFSLTRGGLVADPATAGEDLMVERLSVELGRILFRVPRQSAGELAGVPLTSAQSVRLLDLLDRFCQVHLDLRLRSLRFLASMEKTREKTR